MDFLKTLTENAVKSVNMKIEAEIKKMITEAHPEITSESQYRKFAKERCKIHTQHMGEYNIKTMNIDDVPFITWTDQIDVNIIDNKLTVRTKNPVKL